MDWELAVLQFKGEVCVVFCWWECDAGDELGLAVVVAPMILSSKSRTLLDIRLRVNRVPLQGPRG